MKLCKCVPARKKWAVEWFSCRAAGVKLFEIFPLNLSMNINMEFNTLRTNTKAYNVCGRVSANEARMHANMLLVVLKSQNVSLLSLGERLYLFKHLREFNNFKLEIIGVKNSYIAST